MYDVSRKKIKDKDVIFLREVIEKLVEIENKAHRIIDHASAEKLKLEREKKEELEHYKEKMDLDIEQRLDDLKEKTDKAIRPETETVYEKGNELLSELETRFVNEMEEMAEKVYKRILGA